jgi:hypothetical protein
VGVVDGEEAAPPELRLGWECERYSCLPDAGGYLEQDYELMIRMSSLANIHRAYSRYRNAQGTQIHNLSMADRMILRQLKDIGVLFKA